MFIVMYLYVYSTYISHQIKHITLVVCIFLFIIINFLIVHVLGMKEIYIYGINVAYNK